MRQPPISNNCHSRPNIIMYKTETSSCWLVYPCDSLWHLQWYKPITKVSFLCVHCVPYIESSCIRPACVLIQRLPEGVWEPGHTATRYPTPGNGRGSGQHIEAKTKWTPFFRQHFQMHFLERKCMNFNWNFTEVCCRRYSLQYSSIRSDNGLEPIRWQAIIWTNGG